MLWLTLLLALYQSLFCLTTPFPPPEQTFQLVGSVSEVEQVVHQSVPLQHERIVDPSIQHLDLRPLSDRTSSTVGNKFASEDAHQSSLRSPGEIGSKAHPEDNLNSPIKKNEGELSETYLKRVESTIRNFFKSLREAREWIKYQLDLHPRDEIVPLFSEIHHLDQNFGQAYEFYQSSSEQTKSEFIQTFQRLIKDDAKNFLKTFLLQVKRKLATLRGPSKAEREASILQLTPHLVELSTKHILEVFETRRSIEDSSVAYKESLERSHEAVRQFLAESYFGYSAHEVSERIKFWKIRNPSGDLKLKHPYQYVFLDLFGPQDIGKPSLDDKLMISRLSQNWKLQESQTEKIIEIFDNVKRALSQLYMIQEYKMGRPIGWKMRSKTRKMLRKVGLGWTLRSEESQMEERYANQEHEAKRLLKDAHQEMLGVVPEKEIVDKFSRIQKNKNNEKWADKRHSGDQYLLLPFLDPLRAGRKSDNIHDVTPLLHSFGLSPKPTTLQELQNLSETLAKEMKFQYEISMRARHLRNSIEKDFGGSARYLLLKILNKSIKQVKNGGLQSSPEKKKT